MNIKTSKAVIVPTDVPAPGAQGDICRQSTVTIDLNDPLAQDRAMGYVGGLVLGEEVGNRQHHPMLEGSSTGLRTAREALFQPHAPEHATGYAKGAGDEEITGGRP